MADLHASAVRAPKHRYSEEQAFLDVTVVKHRAKVCCSLSSSPNGPEAKTILLPAPLCNVRGCGRSCKDAHDSAASTSCTEPGWVMLRHLVCRHKHGQARFQAQPSVRMQAPRAQEEQHSTAHVAGTGTRVAATPQRMELQPGNLEAAIELATISVRQTLQALGPVTSTHLHL